MKMQERLLLKSVKVCVYVMYIEGKIDIESVYYTYILLENS